MAKTATATSKVEKAAKGVADAVTKAAKNLAGKAAGTGPAKAKTTATSIKAGSAKPQAGKAAGGKSTATKKKA
jgi:hypothetical protein